MSGVKNKVKNTTFVVTCQVFASVPAIFVTNGSNLGVKIKNKLWLSASIKKFQGL
jgi:hypothetical protein